MGNGTTVQRKLPEIERGAKLQITLADRDELHVNSFQGRSFGPSLVITTREKARGLAGFSEGTSFPEGGEKEGNGLRLFVLEEKADRIFFKWNITAVLTEVDGASLPLYEESLRAAREEGERYKRCGLILEGTNPVPLIDAILEKIEAQKAAEEFKALKQE